MPVRRRPWLVVAVALLATHSLVVYGVPAPRRTHTSHDSSLTIQDPASSFDDFGLYLQDEEDLSEFNLQEQQDKLRKWFLDQEAQPKLAPFEPQLQQSTVDNPNTTLHLWYRQPATSIKEESFLIGNGKTQVLIGGGINVERLVFNEESCWSGGPKEYKEYRGGNVPADEVGHKQEALQAIRQVLSEKANISNNPAPAMVKEILGTFDGFGQQQPFGEILVEELHPFEVVQNYKRELDLSQGVVKVSFTANDIDYTREHFCSYPDAVCVMRIQGSEPKSVNLKVSIATNHVGEFTNIHNRLGFRGNLESNNLTIEAMVAVKAEGPYGVSMSNNRQVVAMNFDAVTLYYTFGTGWTAGGFPNFADVDPHDRLVSVVDKALAAWYNDQYLKHIKDHNDLFSGFSLDLGQTPLNLATDELFKVVKGKKSTDEAETYFDALLVQYGRYLLIASSRPGSLPMTGQSVWSSDEHDQDIQTRYKMNIELQMNYWLAESTNLGETVTPLIDFMEQLLVPRGQDTASQLHSARGWTTHTYSNIWAHTGPTFSASSSYFPAAAAWLCQHVWDRYLYSQDYYYLRDHAYKLMKGAAQFWIDTLVPSHIDGTFVSSPAFSPERGPVTEGTALDQQLIHQLFQSTLDAITVVGERDNAFVQNLTTIFANLSTGLQVGNWGQLQEWKMDIDQRKDVHYYLAPLYALYPGHQIFDQDAAAKEIFLEASRTILMDRGVGTNGPIDFGWAKVWRAALWARVGDSARAYEFLQLFKKKHVLRANLLSFEDQSGLQGYGAALIELLIQSPKPGQVDILADAEGVPKRWLTQGSVIDYKIREGHKVSVYWSECKVQSVEVVGGAKAGPVAFRIGTKGNREAKVLLRGSTKEAVATVDGDTVTFTLAKGQAYNFAPKWGRRYLTSNTFIRDAATNKTVPIGKLYNKFRMKFGTRVMSYGFLYNFKGAGSDVVLEKANVTVTLPWFQKSLKEDVDMYLVVGHTPVRWAETLAVINAIRAVHPAKPILLFGGHMHQRDFVRYDARAFGLAAGRFMETLGWMSVKGIHDRKCRIETNCIGKNLTVSRRYLDTNVHTYKTHALAHPRQKFDTWRGRKISKEITHARASLNLSNALGCAPEDYYLNRYPVTDTRSLINLLANQVLPLVADSTKKNPALILVNSGSQRFDVYKGPFTVDDTYIVSPFHNDFIYTSVPYKIAKNVLAGLNKAPFQKRALPPDDFGFGGDDWPHSAIPYVAAPNYVSSPMPAGLGDNDLVDIVWLSFFTNLMGPILKTLDPNTTYNFSTYRTDIDTNTMWTQFVKAKWSGTTC
ncbi:hypothetical protein BGZ82_001633 [Podila clonocystis]|nr:hypothetical protein BGZ82_001633 [Podila clonocystis]